MSNLLSFYVDPSTGDIEFDEHQRLRTVDGIEAQKQRLRLRLATRLGEWFLDNTFGVPWLDLVEKGVDNRLIEAEIRTALMADDQVKLIESVRLSRLPDRVLHIEFEVRLENGEHLAEEVDVE